MRRGGARFNHAWYTRRFADGMLNYLVVKGRVLVLQNPPWRSDLPGCDWFFLCLTHPFRCFHLRGFNCVLKRLTRPSDRRVFFHSITSSPPSFVSSFCSLSPPFFSFFFPYCRSWCVIRGVPQLAGGEAGLISSPNAHGLCVLTWDSWGPWCRRRIQSVLLARPRYTILTWMSWISMFGRFAAGSAWCSTCWQGMRVFGRWRFSKHFRFVCNGVFDWPFSLISTGSIRSVTLWLW